MLSPYVGVVLWLWTRAVLLRGKGAITSKNNAYNKNLKQVLQDLHNFAQLLQP